MLKIFFEKMLQKNLTFSVKIIHLLIMMLTNLLSPSCMKLMQTVRIELLLPTIQRIQ